MNDVFLVTGGSGLVGSNVAWANRSNYDVVITWKSKPVSIKDCRSEKLDILNKDECLKIIKKYKPDYVIHAAAANWSFSECEQDTRGLSQEGILGATQSIVNACNLTNSKLVFFSTDWVFDGNKPLGEKYDEEELVKPICKYGQYKYESEKYIQENMDNYLILRVSHVYGHNYAKCGNGPLWSEENIKKNSNTFKIAYQVFMEKKIKQTTEVIQNATLATEIGVNIDELLKKNSTGLFHLAGRDPVSRYDFFKYLAKCFDLDPNLIEKGTVEETLMLRGADESTAKKLSKRWPRNTAFSVEKIEHNLQKKMVGYKEGLEKLKEQLADMM